MKKTPFISIVMPAFNEEANIEKTVTACLEALKVIKSDGEVVVTNDGSSDRTLERLKKLSQRFPNLKIVNHKENLGYGAALKSAILASEGDYVVTIDSDGQFDILELPVLFNNAVNGTAVVTGYRRKKADTAFRVIANKGLNLLVTALFGIRLNDINCAFRVYKGELIRKINIESRGYQAPSEIMIKLFNLGYKIQEVEVSHFERKGGRSTLQPLKVIGQMSTFLIYLKLKTLLYRRGIINSL